MKKIRRTTRVDNNLDHRIVLIAKENNISINEMYIYLLELGYQKYKQDFENYFKNQNDILKRKNKNEKED